MIAVLGAGSIGCYVGGMLATAGHPVTLIGRPATVAALSQGLTVSAMDGVGHRTMPLVTDDPAIIAQSNLILVCVKSADTADAAHIIAGKANRAATVISLQNGVTNIQILRNSITPERCARGMVGFNVVRAAPDHFVQTTQGEIIVDPSARDFADLLAPTAIKAFCHRNMEGVAWSKLLMNLNNGLNALSGLPLKAQLENRQWRKVLAMCITEGIAVAKAEGIRLEQLGKIHPRHLPFLLRLPDVIFLKIAQSMLRIDPAARSSMADDYRLGRPSEVRWLNGYVTDRGNAHGLPTPVNQRVSQAVESAFSNPRRTPQQVDPLDLIQT